MIDFGEQQCDICRQKCIRTITRDVSFLYIITVTVKEMDRIPVN